MTKPPAVGLVIRPASIGDAAELARVHARCFAEAWGRMTIVASLEAAGGFGVAACAPDGIAGFGLFRVAADEGEVLTLAVTPERRRQGVGGALLGRAIAEAAARGAAKLFLEVATDSEAAQALYRRFGFRAVGRRHRYYGADDADILALDLSVAV